MPKLLQDYASRQAELRPNAVAVTLGRSSLTYGELETTSSQLAWRLREAGCRRGDRICLLIPKSPAAIVAMLGVIKADAAYIPVDLASPPARLAPMIRISEPWGALVSADTVMLLDDILKEIGEHSLKIGSIERCRLEGRLFASCFDMSEVDTYPSDPPEYENTADDIAHILFTSGSTGVPKGVPITHRNVIAFVEWARNYFRLEPGDRISGHTALHFDLSTFDVYGTLSAGAELHMVPPQLNLLPHGLAEFIRSNGLTQWFSVPSVLNFMAKHDVVMQNDFPTLKRMLWCGEVLPTPTLIHFMQRLPHVRFTNLYGPTEATIASSYYTVPECPRDALTPIPIGTACAGEELLVLDAHLNEVPPGEIGDLYIRGAGLSPGYWKDPEKTAAAFLPYPGASNPKDRIYKTGDLARRGEDGLIYFVGRADTQIKSRGYRIELGEVEAAFHSLECLEECAVVALPTDGFEGNTICCAYVPRQGQSVSPPYLRRQASRLLPSYALPTRWLAMERLPKNANGKIDRPLLRNLFRHDTSAET
ncbi:amino acid adenylation domain-containing protein [Methylocaldum szegediense]|uniref:amino acid adenylation domain-containing protein n=1 Tax=Methylocaldum szegediense TaxID=73780 RepID=UPI0004178155|nr:amino acid adenylation domain-containing protein [Methylocaldum szegediense]